MALQGPIPIEFGLVFPAGVYAAGGFEPVRDFDASSNGRFVQSKDKASGLPLWVVEVIDADATARTRTVKVKVAAQVQLSMPLARDVVKDLAVEHGACVRPIQLRRTDLATGQTEPVLVPCGHTLASVCPSCAERAKNLRAAQCREGWHLDREPVIEPDDPTDEQKWWIETRADAQASTGRRRSIRRRHHRMGRRTSRTRRADQRGRDARQRAARAHRTAAPLDQAAAGCSTPSQAGRRPPNGRQDLHHAGRQDVPAFAVHHAHLPVIRARQGRRYADRSRYLRLHAGGARRAALRRALRPVHAEPAPVRRLRRAVLRRDRATATARAACPHRHARHRLPGRTPRSHRRDLSPGVVAVHRHGSLRRRPPARLGREHHRLPRPGDWRSPAHLG